MPNNFIGKQHDVSECMDNCMFQIETALLKFDGLSGSHDSKGSIVKRQAHPLPLPSTSASFILFSDFSTARFDNVWPLCHRTTNHGLLSMKRRLMRVYY